VSYARERELNRRTSPLLSCGLAIEVFWLALLLAFLFVSPPLRSRSFAVQSSPFKMIVVIEYTT